MVGDAEQMTFYPRPRTKDEASAWIRRNRAFYEEHGFGFWLIEPLPRSRFAGYCGIRPLDLEGVPEISRLVALVHEDHVASRRVAETIGMREERRTLREGDYPAIVYAARLERSATVTRTPA
jgi:RimJ/RimL family protein N-acetyltransferase